MPVVYLAISTQLDEAYGYPSSETKTERTLPLAEMLPTDDQGRVYLAVSAEYCDYILPGEILLDDLLASGDVEEVAAEQYAALLPQPDPSPKSP
jgi:hypothetical protein